MRKEGGADAATQRAENVLRAAAGQHNIAREAPRFRCQSKDQKMIHSNVGGESLRVP